MRSSLGSRARSAANSAPALKSKPISSRWNRAHCRVTTRLWKSRAEIAHAFAKMASLAGPIRDVHSVRVRTTPDGLVVNYHCRVSPYLSVDEVHEHVDELDRKMRAAFRASSESSATPSRCAHERRFRPRRCHPLPCSLPCCGHAASRACSGASFFPSSTIISYATCSPC